MCGSVCACARKLTLFSRFGLHYSNTDFCAVVQLSIFKDFISFFKAIVFFLDGDFEVI